MLSWKQFFNGRLGKNHDSSKRQGIHYEVYSRVNKSFFFLLTNAFCSPDTDAADEKSKIVSIELDPPITLSIKLAGARTNPFDPQRYNYEMASINNYVLSNWYWIYITRSHDFFWVGEGQTVAIYNPQTGSFPVTVTENWSTLPITKTAYFGSDFKVIVNGFKGVAQGFCGRLRGLTVLIGSTLSYMSAFEYLAQQQSGATINKLMLYYPFHSNTGQAAIDGSTHNYNGVFGATSEPETSDPIWETVILSAFIDLTNDCLVIERWLTFFIFKSITKLHSSSSVLIPRLR